MARARAQCTHIKKKRRSEICGWQRSICGCDATVFNIFLRRGTHKQKQIKMLQKSEAKQIFPLTFYGICFIVSELLANADMGRNRCQARDFQTSIMRCVQLRYFDTQLAARCRQMVTANRSRTSRFARVTSVFAMRVVCVPVTNEKIELTYLLFRFRWIRTRGEYLSIFSGPGFYICSEMELFISTNDPC